MVVVRLARRWLLGAPLLMGAACGPVVELDSESGTGSGSSTTADPTQDEGASVDESGAPSGACGVGDTELIGGGPPGPLGFPPPCNPSRDAGTNGYRCCSHDPAAADGQLPAYEGKNIEGGSTPFFSATNNDLSAFGSCVDVTQIAGQGLVEANAESCPIPCNPTWPQASIDEVCGSSRVCCQTVELGPDDCVVDAVTGLFRPVTGDDIGVITQWKPADHDTHQDVNGSNCLALAGGDSSSPVFQSCVRALSVADQRGFCMALGAGQACPHTQPSYVDACEELNGG
jgi:hypothetical protein